MAVGVGLNTDGVGPEVDPVELAGTDPALSESENDPDEEQKFFVESINIEEVGLDEQNALDWLFDCDESPAEWAYDISGCEYMDYPPGPWTSVLVNGIFSDNCFGGVDGLKALLTVVYSYIDSADREAYMAWSASVERGLERLSCESPDV
jgi:hypothetical protein